MAVMNAPPILNNAAVPIVPPNTPPFVGPQPFTPPTVGTFTGTAPTAPTTGAFTAPDPTSLGSDPSFQFDMAQQQKAIQRGAAARGTLLTGGLQTRLQQNASDVAGSHYADIYNRARGTYETNRDTDTANFGRSLGSFNAGLGAFTENTNAALGAGRLGLDASRDAYGRARDTYDDQAKHADVLAHVVNVNAQNKHDAALEDYAREQQQMREAALAPRQATSPYLGRTALGSRR